VKFLASLLLLVGACAHGSSAPETLRNVATSSSCPADTIVVELPSTQSVDAVSTLVAQTKSLTYTPTPNDAVTVIRERIAEFDHADATRLCQ
jgi:hypothetical protein